ncbi:MAG: hypothetical protein MRY64_07840 [Hyphomonadaceae bacterium]|nr:hypothetical protein [Hyphomonadaceae bacterium]
MTDHNTNSTHPMRSLGIAIAAVVIFMMIFAVAKKTGYADPAFAKRGAAAMLGLMLVIAGNFVPKMRLFQPAKGNLAGASAVDRFAGWVFVICGLAFSTVWLFAPLDKAMLGSPMIGVAGFLLVLARWLSWRRGQAGSLVPSFTPGRALVGLLLLSILWAFAIFFVDAIWGDAVAQWTSIVFIIILGGALPFLVLLAQGKSKARH